MSQRLSAFEGLLNSFNPRLTSVYTSENQRTRQDQDTNDNDNDTTPDVTIELLNAKPQISNILSDFLSEHHGAKWYISLQTNMFKYANNETIESSPWFQSRMNLLTNFEDFDRQFNSSLEKINDSLEKYVRLGSGWIFDRVKDITVYYVKYAPFNGASYLPTPKRISNPKCSIINVRNDRDSECFKWSVLAKLHPDPSRKYRVCYLKRFENLYNFNALTYPTTLTEINIFEKNNPQISINVFGWEKDEIYPLRITSFKNRDNHVDLLLLTENKRTHYCLIKNINSLLRGLYKYTHQKFFCKYCLHGFKREATLREHVPHCEPFGAQKTRLPDDKLYKFTNYSLCTQSPVVIYADFECFITPADQISTTTGGQSEVVSNHIPSGFCFVVIGPDGDLLNYKLYSGKNVIDVFLKSLLDEIDELKDTIFSNMDMPLNVTSEMEALKNEATHCYLCKLPFSRADVRVYDHDHRTGKFLGIAHSTPCNINRKLDFFIPVVFHNLKSYDGHLLLQGFRKYANLDMGCIAQTSEKYLSIKLGDVRFLDSLAFMNESLQSLVDNLVQEGNVQSNFKLFYQYFSPNLHSLIPLLLRKGIFPYTYMTSRKTFKEKSLPPKSAFFNDLTMSHISDEDYNHAQRVWTEFKVENMEQYHNLYLLTDTLHLASIFQKFRSMILKNYEIEPLNVYSTPGLSWNAMLKMTNVQLDLITDIDQYIMIESGIRGGLSQISHRYAKANNPMVENYDPSKPTSWIVYFDCTNLYGTAMSEILPQKNFQWLSRSEIDNIDFSSVSDVSPVGYILEVDLIYSPELHDLHNSYPVAPQKMEINAELLSPFCLDLADQYNITSQEPKLLTTLFDKEKYVCHYKTLQLYLHLGLKLKHVHRVISFEQSAWLKPFIDLNTLKRQEAKSTFESNLFKLMTNSVYGRSIMNVRRHTDFKLVANKNKLMKWAASPRLKSLHIFEENFAGLALSKQSCKLATPLYAGFACLEYAKKIMAEFHYNYILKTYGPENAKLLFTDTDSLMYYITTENVYDDMLKSIHLFDTSDYPKDHKCRITYNRKKLGSFKDETNAVPIREFVGLRPKCYSFTTVNNKEKQVAKGVPRAAIQKQLRHAMYKKCLLQHVERYTQSKNIRSKNHRIRTVASSKLSLSPFDSKRYIWDDGITSYAYGHYKIK